MSAKLFLSSAIKFIPQMDMSIQYTENGGIEASQTFLARRSDLTTASANLALFTRGRRWEELYPEVPPIYRELTMKTFDPDDYAPGIIAIKGTFTGYQFSTNGSSGSETEVPTTDLQGTMEEAPINRHKKWVALSSIQKKRLGWLMNGYVLFNPDTVRWGALDDGDGSFTDFDTGGWPEPTGDELIFATMIAEGDTTYKRPAWDYNYRTESKTGFTAAQLASHGKIVSTPQGSPTSPGTGWTWLLVGPSQSQSGPDRFVKDLRYAVIEDNAKNQMLYGA